MMTEPNQTPEQLTQAYIEYARVGDKYQQRVYSPNTHNYTYIIRDKHELKADGIVLQSVPKFSMFTNLPSHTNYERNVCGAFNLYEELPYIPQKGRYKTTIRLLIHIFGDQWKLALDYLSILWQRPTQMLPIIVLLSKEQSTGKSTFMRWLRKLFGANVTILNVSQYCQQFNGVFATKLVICIDEAALSEEFIRERLKQDSTQTEINLRRMHTDYTTLPFYGKFVIASNKELDFCKLESDDLRFWVRKVPKFESYDPDFMAKLESEVPAFAEYLQERKIVTPNAGRMWFTPEQIETDALRQVRENSISDCAKDLRVLLDDLLSADPNLKISATELSDRLGKRHSLHAVRKAMGEELGLKTLSPRYYPQPYGATRCIRAYDLSGYEPQESTRDEAREEVIF